MQQNARALLHPFKAKRATLLRMPRRASRKYSRLACGWVVMDIMQAEKQKQPQHVVQTRLQLRRKTAEKKQGGGIVRRL